MSLALGRFVMSLSMHCSTMAAMCAGHCAGMSLQAHFMCYEALPICEIHALAQQNVHPTRFELYAIGAGIHGCDLVQSCLGLESYMWSLQGDKGENRPISPLL